MPSDSPRSRVLEQRDELLYHYSTLRTAVEHVLPGLLFRMSPLSRMRDPRESGRWLVTGGLYGEVSGIDGLRSWQEVTDEINALKDRCKIMSLTQDAFGDADVEMFRRGFARARLWEHYAGNHFGVCLCFDKERLIATLQPRLSALGKFLHGRVVYEDAAISPDALFADLGNVIENGIDSVIEEHLGQHAGELFFKKLTDWETEHEYRLVVITSDTDAVTVDVGPALQAVIVGDAVAQGYEPAIHRLCEPHGIDVLRIRWESGRPVLCSLDS